MTKKELIELLAPYSDDVTILIPAEAYDHAVEISTFLDDVVLSDNGKIFSLENLKDEDEVQYLRDEEEFSEEQIQKLLTQTPSILLV